MTLVLFLNHFVKFDLKKIGIFRFATKLFMLLNKLSTENCFYLETNFFLA